MPQDLRSSILRNGRAKVRSELRTEQLDGPSAFWIDPFLSFSHDLAGRLVLAQALVGRVSQGIGAGPLGENNLRDQLRPDPDRTALCQTRNRFKRRRLLLNRLKLFQSPGRLGTIQSRTD